MEQVFIARKKQLVVLTDLLARSIAGQGQVCFVSGEAGSGKTTLVKEFTRRVQAKDKELAVAVGLCDAQTGIGDAYLPFREVMGQLTGDVENKLAQGAITQENAGRLRNMLVLAGQAIVDVGPDLVGVFVPGVGLATKLGAFVAEKVGWLEKLDKLVDKPKQKVGESGIEESHIFEQYANVLCRIAEKNPLLIVLDDLHWGDAASINLLFHLGRRIADHRILILGTYRSAEVAIGRGGERHPLEKVLAEFKRYYGDITIDLDKAVEEEGVAFVTEFLATEPNNLEDEFKKQLYSHTGGHPLFTVELLRNMQERGDLVKDTEGKWIESESLDWDKLPTKVEGVIEERIGRLQAELKEVLTIGSVQGEDFTAEVVARVQQAEARGLIRQLSGELDRQHRLVKAEGVRRLESGGQRLSLFRFQHNLFRSYLYNELSEAERAYMHEDVGEALEGLYGEQTDEIAVQLAHHYEMAEMDEKARYYLQKAGEQAVARYANEEAIDYFTRALALIPEGHSEQRYELLMAREERYSYSGNREAQLEDLDKLSEILDQQKIYQKEIAEVLLRKSAYYEQRSMYAEALNELQNSLEIAHQLNSESLEARIQKALGYVLWRRGTFKEAKEEAEKALSLAKKSGMGQLQTEIMHDLAIINWRMGNVEEAERIAGQALDRFTESGNRRGQSLSHSVLGNIALTSSNYDAAKKHYLELHEIDVAIGDIRGQGMSQGNLGIIAEVEGDHTAAVEIFKRVRDVFHRMGDYGSEARAWAHIGLDYALQGVFDKARVNYEKAIELYREIENKQGLQWVLSLLAWLCIDKQSYDEAQQYCITSLDLAEEAGYQSGAELCKWLMGRIYLAKGQLEKAEKAFQESVGIQDSGDRTSPYSRMYLASMADVALAKDEKEQALAMVNKLLEDGYDLTSETDNKNRVEILLTCYKVLQANDDPRQENALRHAYEIIQKQAKKISDKDLRKSYLENVIANREVIRYFHQNK